MTLSDYNTGVSLLITSYQSSGDAATLDSYIAKGIRMSQHVKLSTYEQKTLALLHRITRDTDLEISDLSAYYSSSFVTLVNEYQQLTTETNVAYNNRLNTNDTLALVRWVELDDSKAVINNSSSTYASDKANYQIYQNLLTSVS